MPQVQHVRQSRAGYVGHVAAMSFVLFCFVGGASGWTNACSDTAAEQGLVDSLAVPSHDLVSRNSQLLVGP